MNSEQIEFLKKHGIPQELTFDATGLSKSDYHKIMGKEGKIIAYNVSPCEKAGHTLRTRSGHCIQCNTASIAFITRNVSFGIVYIAGSKEGELMKIGSTKEMKLRADSLNKTKYGGMEDWEILWSSKVLNVGSIEDGLKKILGRYSYKTEYDHDNHIQETYEIFKCSYLKVKEAVKKLEMEGGIKFNEITENKLSIGSYNFKNLTKI